jgi:exosortase B
MTIEAPAAVFSSGRGIGARPWLPLLAGFLVLAIPTVVNLGQQVWSTDIGAHGPIVVATGLWLLYHEGMRLGDARDAAPWRRVLVLVLPAFALYVFGRAYDFISLEVLGLYGTFIAFLWRLFGFKQLRSVAFPLFYLGFVIPPPGWLIDRATAPLQLFVSHFAENVTSMLGYPVAREGVTLFVGQYELLVEQACAGMNSIIGLIAVSLFYIYIVRKASLRYASLLVLLILPVAVVVNIIRIVVLILITYHFGDEAAQGFLHGTTGMVLFGMALLLIFGADTILWRLAGRRNS